ncbi:MAG: DUF1194 domain-containing protein [Hyphomicrobiales bacterium]
MARWILGLTAVLLGLAMIAVTGQARAQTACADVNLVLAVDGSSSISDSDFALQRHGIANAFRDPAVLAAMQRAGVVAVSAVFWGDSELAVQKTGWITIAGPADGERFARIIEGVHRKVLGNTGLGTGLDAALDMIEDPAACAGRSIINVSGDGRETIYPRRRRVFILPEQARARASALGVTINALVIAGREPGLPAYFTDRVITGPGSFVMAIHDLAGFSTALRRKLIREISPIAISSRD